MKKILLAVVFMIAATVAINAQPRAVGARLGYGLQASYEHSLSEKNMIEIEFGFPGFYGVEAAATYDWIFPITNWEHAGSWNWYAGVGAAAGYSGFGWYYGYGYVGVAGRIGVEYNFEFPLQLSADFRPVVGAGFGNYYTHNAGVYYDLYAGAIGISARYRF